MSIRECGPPSLRTSTECELVAEYVDAITCWGDDPAAWGRIAGDTDDELAASILEWSSSVPTAEEVAELRRIAVTRSRWYVAVAYGRLVADHRETITAGQPDPIGTYLTAAIECEALARLALASVEDVIEELERAEMIDVSNAEALRVIDTARRLAPEVGR